MSKDLNFGNLDYNNAVLFLFIGYVGMQIPAGFILAKIPPAFFLTGAVCVWGVVSMCCGFIHTVPQMLALRFLVGVAEAVSIVLCPVRTRDSLEIALTRDLNAFHSTQPFFPGALLILSSFYTRKELAIRIAIMYSGNSLSNCFGGLLAAAIISGLQGKGGLAGWRWLFILEGAVTVVSLSLAEREHFYKRLLTLRSGLQAVGASIYFVLPSYPSKTRFFSEEQRRLAVWRTTQDANGEPDEGGEKSLVKGAKLVLKDWKVCLACWHIMGLFAKSSRFSPDCFTDSHAHLPANVYQLFAKLFLFFSVDSEVAWIRFAKDFALNGPTLCFRIYRVRRSRDLVFQAGGTRFAHRHSNAHLHHWERSGYWSAQVQRCRSIHRYVHVDGRVILRVQPIVRMAGVDHSSASDQTGCRTVACKWIGKCIPLFLSILLSRVGRSQIYTWWICSRRILIHGRGVRHHHQIRSQRAEPEDGSSRRRG
jgi:MFS family permease